MSRATFRHGIPPLDLAGMAMQFAPMKVPRSSAWRLASALVLATTANAQLSPDEAVKAFQHEPDVRVELVAAEPLVMSPCAMAFDERGHLFVAENRGYPNTANPPQGDIALLEDTDADGRMDKRTVFADGLTFPNGVMPWKGGVIVTCAPDVLFLKDTDGDGKADERKVLLTGFATSGSTQLRVNCPTLGPDGWIYFAAGLSGGEITSPEHPERPAVKMTADLRSNPQSGEIENTDGRSQYGMSFDDFGRRFICMNRVPVQHVVLSAKVLARNPHLAFSETVQDCNERTVKTGLRGGGDGVRLFPISKNITTADSHAGSFSAACAITIWRGGALPEKYRGCAFTCDPTGNLVHVDRLEPRGATFAAVPMFDKEQREFLASRDDWHRPVFLTSGPDGALYVCDMYRKTIEHPDYLPEEIRKRTDFESGKEMGRIWRVMSAATTRKVRDRNAEIAAKIDADRKSRPPDFRERAVRALGEETIAKADKMMAAKAALEHDIREVVDPFAWQRETACRLLWTRTIAEFESPMDSLRKEAASRLQAQYRESRAWEYGASILPLTTFPPLQNPAENGAILRARDYPPGTWLPSGDARFFEVAWVRAQGRSTELGDLTPVNNEPADLELALALGDCSSDRSLQTLGKIATTMCADRWVRAAVLSGIAGREQAFARTLLEKQNLQLPGARDLLTETCALPAIVADPTFLTDHVKETTNGLRHRLSENASLLLGIAEGLGKRLPQPKALPLLQLCEQIVDEGHSDLRDCVSAMRALACLDGARANAAFVRVNAASNRSEILAEWARLCLLFDAQDRVEKLLDPANWNALPPESRTTAISTLVRRPHRRGLLLDAIENSVVQAASVSANDRATLLKSGDPAIRERTEKLFGKAVAGDRTKAFDEAKVVLTLKPDAEHGHEVFKTLCAPCHWLDREGYNVGPDLLDMRNQPKESIIFHIVVPDAEVAPAFASYLVETKDGRTLSGILASETASSLSLRMPLGVEETILRTNVAKLEALPGSLMPAGLEAAMSRQDLADLLGFLKGER